MYLNGDCKSEFGENDHRSPCNRAQGQAYGQNACGVILPISRPYKDNPKFHFKANHFHRFHNLLRLSGQEREMCPAFPHTQHFLSKGDLGLGLVPRLCYDALRVRAVNEPRFTGTGRLVALAITFATSASSLVATSFINTC